MPQWIDDCVTRIMKDPKFKPKDPKQGKSSAAWAVCTAQYKKLQKNFVKANMIIKEVKKQLDGNLATLDKKPI